MNKRGIIRRIGLQVRNILRFHFPVPFLGNIEWVWPKYRIPGTRNIDVLENTEHKNPLLSMESYSVKLIKLMQVVGEHLNRQKCFTLVRLGDSELFFLQGEMVGNIVTRSFLTDDITRYDLSRFRRALDSNDYVCEHKLLYMRCIKPEWIRVSKDFDFDTVYTSIASKLLFYQLRGYRVGLIGAEEKLRIIQKLVQYSEYQEYTGIREFHEYIGIPQLGASQDIDYTIELIEHQLKGRCDIFLVGMSVAKIIIMPYLRDKYKKSFLDVGVGIDALAGIIPNTKPYYGNWINFRMKDYDYSNINFFSYQTGRRKKVEHIRWLS